jgi:hypothetical protein
MKRPGGLRGVVGTPVVTLLVVAGACLGPYAWYMNPDAWPLGVAGLWVIGWVANANAAVARYTAWKRQWDAMGPGGAAPRVSDRPAFKVAVLVLAVVALAVFLSAHPDRPGYALAFNWLMGGGICALVGWLALRRLRSTARPFWAPKRREREADVVGLSVRSPLIRVPDLKGAYDALPEHCWRALNAR